MRKNTVTHRPTTSVNVFKTVDTLEEWGNGFRVYNNFIQKNNGSYLNGQTPAQACGIDILGKNRWLSLLKLSLEKFKN